MDELPSLLALRQPLKVRQGAAELILGLTSDAASVLQILSNKALMSSVWDGLADKDKHLSVTAAQILVNITSHSDKYTPPDQIIPDLLQVFHNSKASFLFNNIAMILNNISRSPDQAGKFSEMIYLADCQMFVKLISRQQEQGYLAAVLGNIAVTERGREQLLDKTVLPELISFLTMPGNLIVRRNTARLLRNLSFDIKLHPVLVEYLPQIVYPLVGGEEIDEDDMDKLPIDLQYLPEDKAREPDLQTRVLISDTLFQMAGSYSVRETYRNNSYYTLLKHYDQWEEDSDARERVQNVIYLIIQDDGEADLRQAGEVPDGCEEVGEAAEVVEQKVVGEKLLSGQNNIAGDDAVTENGGS